MYLHIDLQGNINDTLTRAKIEYNFFFFLNQFHERILALMIKKCVCLQLKTWLGFSLAHVIPRKLYLFLQLDLDSSM